MPEMKSYLVVNTGPSGEPVVSRVVTDNVEAFKRFSVSDVMVIDVAADKYFDRQTEYWMEIQDEDVDKVIPINEAEEGTGDPDEDDDIDDMFAASFRGGSDD